MIFVLGWWFNPERVRKQSQQRGFEVKLNTDTTSVPETKEEQA